MNKKDFQTIISNLTTQLNNFAYCLIPDELQSNQMVIDAITIYLTEGEHQWLKSSSLDFAEIKDHIYKNLLKKIFILGARRVKQLDVEQVCEFEIKFGQFYGLQLVERALLFLKKIEKFDITTCQDIVDFKRSEVVFYYLSAKRSLIKSIEKEPQRNA